MLTVELSKCRYCGATQAADAPVCPSCGTKPRRSSSRPASGRKKTSPFGLDSAALLDKINALDWDPTTTMSGPPPTPRAAAPSWRFLVAPVLAGLTILVVGAVALLYFTATPDTVSAREPIPVAPPSPASPEPVVAPPEISPAAEEARETERSAERERALQATDDANKRKAEKKRKALAEQQARDEQERQRRADDERRRSEQEAAEARARAAAAVPPAPKGPASPRELCANEGGVFTRNSCEARACDQPEWRHHAFCVKRWQDEMRKLNPS